MAVSKEVIESITNFCPKDNLNGQRVDLGKTNSGIKIGYGRRVFQKRAMHLPGEPLILDWWAQPGQPVIFIEENGRITSLAYRSDILALGEDRAREVADHLRAQNRRNTHDWPEDF